MKHLYIIPILALFISLNAQAAFEFTDQDDIPQWAEESIQIMEEQGIMKGFGDGSFRPNQPLNRAEAVIILLRLKNLESESETPGDDFNDVPKDAWFAKAVRRAVKSGWIKGKSARFFYPGDALNRAEWTTLMSRAFPLEIDEAVESSFRDVPSQVWFSESVHKMLSEDLIRHPNSNYFLPEKTVTRAEAAWTMAKILTRPSLTGQVTSEMSNREFMRRVSIKPRDFNANKQAANVAQKEVAISVDPRTDEAITIEPDDTWHYVGDIHFDNTLEGLAEISLLQIKLLFERSSAGPASNFEIKIVGPEFNTTEVLSNRGELTVIAPNISLNQEEQQVYKTYLRAREEEQYFTNDGDATLFIYRAEAEATKTASTGSTIKHFSKVTIKDRYFANILFTPITE